MNIFEHLGLAANHRKENKVTQLVKHYAEVIDKHKQGKRLAVQLKEDGVCAITVIRDGMATIFSRTGRKFTNTSELCQYISHLHMRDGVYFGEMVCSNVSLEKLSGAVNPNRTKPLDSDEVSSNLRMRFFDLISIHSFVKGTSDTPYWRRYNNLVERVNEAVGESEREDAISVIPLIMVQGEGAINKYLNMAVERGEEGLVIVNLDADWEAGHKGWRKMKLVRGCDYDLRCIGYEEGKGKYVGLVANLVFQWKKGETIKCMLGKGWTHEMAREMFQEIQAGHKDSPIGKVFQVYALEESSKGKLRLPKVGEQRMDKSEADV